MKIHSLIYLAALSSMIAVACQSKSSAPAGAQPGPKNEEPETEQPAPESNADTAPPASPATDPAVVVTPAPVSTPAAPPLLPIVTTPLYDLDDGYNLNIGKLDVNTGYNMNDTSGSLCKSDYYGKCRTGQTDFSQTSTWTFTLDAPATLTIYNYGGTHTLQNTLPTIHVVILDAAGRPVYVRAMPCDNGLDATFTLYNQLPAGSYSLKFVIHTQELGKVIYGFKVRTT